MRIKYCFEIMDLDDGKVAVPIGGNEDPFYGVLKINETAARILELMREDTTEERIVEELMQQYEGERTQITSYVHAFIETLNTEGLLEE